MQDLLDISPCYIRFNEKTSHLTLFCDNALIKILRHVYHFHQSKLQEKNLDTYRMQRLWRSRELISSIGVLYLHKQKHILNQANIKYGFNREKRLPEI